MYKKENTGTLEKVQTDNNTNSQQKLVKCSFNSNQIFAIFQNSGSQVNGLLVDGSVSLRLWDGSCYQGFIKNNFPEGQGKYTDNKGRVFEGIFKDGVLKKLNSSPFPNKKIHLVFMPSKVSIIGINFVVLFICLEKENSIFGEGYLLR